MNNEHKMTIKLIVTVTFVGELNSVVIPLAENRRFENIFRLNF